MKEGKLDEHIHHDRRDEYAYLYEGFNEMSDQINHLVNEVLQQKAFFFRGLPEELEESAKLDGANQWQIMTRIFVPLSKPSIATITLLSLVYHWNSWFEGLIYSNYTKNYPLQSYLQTIVTSTTEILKSGDVEAIMAMTGVNDTNMQSAQIFISIIPLMIVYPFLQKYFTTGLTVGSVKG